MAAGAPSRAQLWQKYFEESTAQLQDLDRHLQGLRANPGAAEPLEAVQRIFHNFAGSGTLYAAPQIAALGGEGEYMSYSAIMMNRPLTSEELEQFGQLVRRIRTELQALVSAASQAAVGARASQRGVPRLLLATPDQEAQRLLCDYLSKRGLQVDTASTLAEADQKINAGLPDLAAVGTGFPDGSGYDFVRNIRSRESSAAMPIVLFGENATFLDKVEAIHCGSDAFLNAPPDPSTLFKKLKGLLARRKAGAARILAVEDDPSQGRFLDETLTSEGYLVRVLADPTRFEAELHAFRPNLILMDILLPSVNGYDLVKFLRQEEGFAAVPVIFLSTEGQVRSQVRGAEAGGDDYLVKPISPTDLVATVRSRLVRYRSLQDLMDHDELTALLAHVPFLQQARLCLSRFSRRQIPYALVFVQIDQMEDHIRRHGAKVRDLLVQSLARFLQRKVRQTDIMGLYGENLVGIVLEHLTDGDAARLIRRLQAEFAAMDQPAGEGRVLRTTFSAGIAMTAHQFKTLKDWIDAGTGALEFAKQFGTGRTIVAGQQIPEE